jgi:hypothetical protein
MDWAMRFQQELCQILEIDILKALDLPDYALFFDNGEIVDECKECPISDEKKDEFRKAALNALSDGAYLSELERKGYNVSEEIVNALFTSIKG